METNDGWQRSSFCNSGSCVEVKRVDTAYAIRDGKDPDGPVLLFSEIEMQTFFAGVKADEFA